MAKTYKFTTTAELNKMKTPLSAWEAASANATACLELLTIEWAKDPGARTTWAQVATEQATAKTLAELLASLGNRTAVDAMGIKF